MSELTHLLRPIHRKLDLILFNQGVMMADTSAAVAILDEIDGEESELATDYRGLLEKISTLSANQAPSQEEVDALTEHAAKIAAGFKALHDAEASGAPAPSTDPEEVAPPAGSSPVATETPSEETKPATPGTETTFPSETATPVSTTPPVSTETTVSPPEPAA